MLSYHGFGSSFSYTRIRRHRLLFKIWKILKYIQLYLELRNIERVRREMHIIELEIEFAETMEEVYLDIARKIIAEKNQNKPSSTETSINQEHPTELEGVSPGT